MKLILVFLSFFVPFTAFAAKDIAISKVEFVYQLDSDSTVFELTSSLRHPSLIRPTSLRDLVLIQITYWS